MQDVHFLPIYTTKLLNYGKLEYCCRCCTKYFEHVFSGDPEKKTSNKASADASYSNPAFHADERDGTGRPGTLSGAEQGGYLWFIPVGKDFYKMLTHFDHTVMFQHSLFCTLSFSFMEKILHSLSVQSYIRVPKLSYFM